MEIRRFGVGGRMRECEEILSRKLSVRGGRLILLPIPTTTDNKYVKSTDITLESLSSITDEETLVVGYGIPSCVRDLEAVGARIFDTSLDEKFLVENARLTANGAMGYILTHFNKDIKDMNVGIVGYGRIGRELTRLCLFFGAKIRMLTARESVAMELCEIGIDTKIIGEKNDLSGLDVLINTTPKKQLSEEDLRSVPMIVDLASGSIFEPSERLVKLSSIPDAFYPVTAGRLYADSVTRFVLSEEV